jgi:hypothetical protein
LEFANWLVATSVEQTVILRKSQSINCVIVRIAPSQTFLRGDLENNTKACVATHHPVIGGLGFFERKNLTAEAIYADWLIFRLCCAPLFA